MSGLSKGIMEAEQAELWKQLEGPPLTAPGAGQLEKASD